MRILITGASGFLGGNLVLLLSNKHLIAAQYNSKQPELKVLDAANSSHQCDLADEKSTIELIEQCQPDCVMHCAALARTAYCEKHPLEAEAINVGATKNLLKACANLKTLNQRAPLFILCSTDLVFEALENSQTGFLETQSPKPLSVYAQSKLRAEALLEDYPKQCSAAATSQNPTAASCIFRLSLIYGPEVNGVQGFISWIRQRLENGRECDLFIDEFRTPVCVTDIAEAVSICAEKFEQGLEIPKILNLAGSQQLSRFEFGQQLCTYANYPPELLSQSSRSSIQESPTRPENVSLNCQALQKLLGRSPLNIKQGLANCQIPKQDPKEDRGQ